MAQWVSIPKDELLQVGDRVRFHYSAVGLTYTTAAQIALVEDRLEKEKRFTIVSHSLPKKEGWVQTFFFEVRVVDLDAAADESAGRQEASILSVAMVAAVLTGALGFALWAGFNGATKLQEAKTETRETELEIIKAGGEIPVESTLEGVVEEAGWTSLKIAGAVVLVIIAWRWIE